MDLDLAKELGQVQERKLALEAGTELRGKCDTIIELDQRVGLLSGEVRALYNEIVQRFDLETVWGQLNQPYRILCRTNSILDLLVGLNKLNRICRRIDTNPNLIHSEDRQSIKLNPRRNVNPGTDDENGDEKCTTILHVLDLLEEFDSNYTLFEQILSKRTDLPYSGYATKVRSLKKVLQLLKDHIFKST